jgi:hypothetical protein
MSAGYSGAIGHMNTWGGSLLGVCYSSEFSKPEYAGISSACQNFVKLALREKTENEKERKTYSFARPAC